MCELFMCEEGWLPTDGETDAVYLEDDGVEYEYLSLLLPTEFTACPCNPLSSLNTDLEGVVIYD